MELGQPTTDRSLTKLRNQLPEGEHDGFNQAIRGYLDKQLKHCEEGATAEVPQQIEAHGTAKLLAERFSSTPQGKKAREIVTKFGENEQFKKEQSAALAYQKAMATSANPSAVKRALVKVSTRYPETHFGKLASEKAQSAAQ
jgi:hypothetical protein